MRAIALVRLDPGFTDAPLDSRDWDRAISAVSLATGEDDALALAICKEVRDLHASAKAFSAWTDPGAPALLSLERSLDALTPEPGQAFPWVVRLRMARSVLRAARCEAPTAHRRVLALYLVASVILAPSEAELPVFRQYDPSVAEASDRARIAHASVGTAPPSLAQARSLPAHAIASAYRAALATVATGAAEPHKAHANDAQAMFLASPFAPEGKSDDRSKAILAKESARLRALVAAGATSSHEPYPPGHSPAVDGVRLAHAHLEFKDECPHCLRGCCNIFEVAALATRGPLAWFPGRRPRPDREGRARTYPLPPHEVEIQGDAVNKLLTTGRASVVSKAPYVSPTFLVTKGTYAESAQWAAHELSRGDLRANIDARIKAAMEAAGLGAKGPPSPSQVAEALAHGTTSSSRRLVYDYSATVNECGVSWPFAMSHANEMISRIVPGSWGGSHDVAEGFLKISLAPEDTPYLAFARLPDGAVVEPHRLPFGVRQGPAHFSTLSAEMAATGERRIRHALGQDCPVIVPVFIDDFFTLNARSQSEGDAALDILEAYGEEVGAPFKRSKRRAASQVIPLLGNVVNTVTMTVSTSADKQYNCLYLSAFYIRLAERGFALPTASLRKLVGKLQHLTAVWPRGTAHMAALYAACDEAGGSTVAAAACPAAVSALRYWRGALSSTRPGSLCVPMDSSPHAPPRVLTFSDASGDGGFSLSIGPLLLWGRWLSSVMGAKTSIGMLEFYPVAFTNEVYGDMLQHLRWLAHTDNLPNAFSILRGTTDDRQLRPWLSAFHMARREMSLAAWTPREFNTYQDEGSKAATTALVRSAMRRYLY